MFPRGLRPWRALQAGRHFQNVIRDARIGARQAVENVVEWNIGLLTTRFAACDDALGLVQSCSIDEHDALLFGSGRSRGKMIGTYIRLVLRFRSLHTCEIVPRPEAHGK